MLKMFRYVKDRWFSIVLIVLLLFLQAYCDLSMPDYTSRIVNIGIQQKGIEDGVSEEIRQSTMEDLFLFMTEEETARVQENYTVTDDRFCPKLFGIFCPESDRISVRQRLLLRFLADIFL